MRSAGIPKRTLSWGSPPAAAGNREQKRQPLIPGEQEEGVSGEYEESISLKRKGGSVVVGVLHKQQQSYSEGFLD